MQKASVFGQMSDKVTSVFVNINFGAKMSILCKRNEILGEMIK